MFRKGSRNPRQAHVKTYRWAYASTAPCESVCVSDESLDYNLKLNVSLKSRQSR